MKLKNFILKLQKLQQCHGDDLDVIMADNIPVINPVYTEKYPGKKNIVITDKK